MIESVAVLRQKLEALGSGLLVTRESPEEFLIKVIGPGKTTVVYQQEICDEEQRVEKALIAKLNANDSVKFVPLVGQTLLHLEDLPSDFI